ERGRMIVAGLAPRLTGGLLTIGGLSGRFPDRLKAAEGSLRDPGGVWTKVNDFELDWSPFRLLRGTLAVDRIAAAEIARVRRLVPAGGRPPPWRSRAGTARLLAGRLAAGGAGPETAASLALDGSAAIAATGEGHVVLTAKGISAPGTYRVAAHLGAAGVDL